MRFMDGNPHYTESLANATELAEHASAQATLVLAHEQRTANLLRYYQLIEDDDHRVVWEIKQRLGLEQS